MIESEKSTMAESVLLPRCDPEEAGFRITDYFSDLEAYFIALKIVDAGRKWSFLQLSLTKETKATLADIYYPEELKDKNYDAVKTTLLDHYKDKKLTLVYREKFNQRVQQEGETCKKYFESLRELARLCDYSAEFYKEQMYDRSIVGLTNEMWKANLSMKDRTTHTYQQIQTLAIQYEEHKLTAENLCPDNTTGGRSSATTVVSVNTYQQKKRFNTYKQKNYGKSNNHNRKKWI